MQRAAGIPEGLQLARPPGGTARWPKIPEERRPRFQAPPVTILPWRRTRKPRRRASNKCRRERISWLAVLRGLRQKIHVVDPSGARDARVWIHAGIPNHADLYASNIGAGGPHLIDNGPGICAKYLLRAADYRNALTYGAKTESDALVGSQGIGLDPTGKAIGGARLDDRLGARGLQSRIMLAVKREAQRLFSGKFLRRVESKGRSLEDRWIAPTEGRAVDVGFKAGVPDDRGFWLQKRRQVHGGRALIPHAAGLVVFTCKEQLADKPIHFSQIEARRRIDGQQFCPDGFRDGQLSFTQS